MTEEQQSNADPAEPPRRARVFLVICDESDEMAIALHYACRRARNSGGRVALLAVIEPPEFQQWMSVADLMHEEKWTAAENMLQRLGKTVIEKAGSPPVFYIREGSLRDEIAALVEEDPSVSVLVLAASSGESPGPLVTHIVGKGPGTIRIPVTIIPAGLTEEDLDPVS